MRGVLVTAAMATVVGASSIGSVAQGAAIPMVNPSFEAPDAIGNGALMTITGWGQGADTGVTNDGPNGGPGTPPTASDGAQIGFLGNGTNFTNIWQDVANAGTSGVTAYVFTISIAKRAGFGETPGTNGTNPINVGIVDLGGGPSLLVTTPVSRAALTNTFQDFSVILPAATVDAGEGIRVFVDKSAGNGLIVVDNARLVAVPEPTVMAAAGLLGVGLVRRRR